MKAPLSACIIAMDEEERIGACLESLAFCDEILVVDSHSRDRTRELAAARGARVIERDWPGHVAQKEHAIRAAAHDWVLCLDADEQLSPELRAQIVALQQRGFEGAQGWRFPRCSEYLGRWIRHGTWYPDRQLRLFDRRRGHWGGRDPHDRVELDGRVGELAGELLHRPYRTLGEHLETIESYTSIMARGMWERGERASALDLLTHPLARVLRFYVLKRGFLDGWRGLLLALLAGWYVFLKYAKLLVRARWPQALPALALLLLLLSSALAAPAVHAAGAQAPGLPTAPSWQLADALARAPALELSAPTPEALAAARAALVAHGASTVLASAPEAPRVVLGTPADAQLRRLAARARVEIVPGGFSFLGRIYTGDDAFLGTFEDPERAGQPLTVLLANDVRSLVHYARALAPRSLSCFAVWRTGELERAGRLEPERRLLPSVEFDAFDAWRARASSDSRLEFQGVALEFPRAADAGRMQFLLAQCVAARTRARAWSAEGTPLLGTRLYVHARPGDMHALTGELELALENPLAGSAHVLLAPGLPHDSGAAVARLAARAALGAPALPWLEDAAAAYAARAWWGIDLGQWQAWLARSEALPALAQLLEAPRSERAAWPTSAARSAPARAELSPHLAVPLRALAFEVLLEERGAAWMRGLWRGEHALPAGEDALALERGWQQRLDELGSQHADALALRARRRALPGSNLAEGARAGGFVLESGWTLGGAHWAGPSARESLQQAHAQGARLAFLPAMYCPQPLERALPGALARRAHFGLESDAALAAACVQARSAGHDVWLAFELLASPWSGYLGQSTLTSVEQWAAFFEDYARVSTHVALLAELLGLPGLCIGASLPSATSQLEGEPLRQAGEFGLAIDAQRRSGWLAVIASVRAATSAALTYVARWDGELREVTFWSELDCVGYSLFAPLGFNAEQRLPAARLADALGAQLLDAQSVASAHGKPLLALAGASSSAEAWRRPWTSRGPLDLEQQRAWCRALRAAWAHHDAQGPKLAGLCLWQWSPDPAAGGPRDRGFALQNKPAEAELRALFEGR
jgi:glycosyltransferase involved in cell wall biosynthesis